MEYTTQNLWGPVIQSRYLGQRVTVSPGSAALSLCDPGSVFSLSTPLFPHLQHTLDRRPSLIRLKMKSASTPSQREYLLSLFTSVLGKCKRGSPLDGPSSAESLAPEWTPQMQELSCVHPVVQPDLS